MFNVSRSDHIRGCWCVLNVQAPAGNKIMWWHNRCTLFLTNSLSMSCMKILLEDFKTKMHRKDVFKPTIGNGSLHKVSNSYGVKVMNFTTSKSLVVKSTIFWCMQFINGRFLIERCVIRLIASSFIENYNQMNMMRDILDGLCVIPLFLVANLRRLVVNKQHV